MSKQLAMGQRSDAIELAEALALSQALASDSQVRGVESPEEAEQLATKYENRVDEDPADVLRKGVKGTRLEIDHVVDTVRSNQAKHGEDPAVDLIVFVDEVLERVRHLGRTFERNDVGAELQDPKLEDEVLALRETIQRLIYWLTYDGRSHPGRGDRGRGQPDLRRDGCGRPGGDPAREVRERAAEMLSGRPYPLADGKID